MAEIATLVQTQIQGQIWKALAKTLLLTYLKVKIGGSFGLYAVWQ